MNRKKRLDRVSEILGSTVVTDQEELRLHLEKDGLAVSQASLSRDLKELGAQRIRRVDGTFAYALPEERPAATTMENFRKRFAMSVSGVRRTNFIVLVFTPPGEAQFVGRLLDQASIKGLLGTVAGDDTIVCVADNNRNAQSLEKLFNEIIR